MKELAMMGIYRWLQNIRQFTKRYARTNCQHGIYGAFIFFFVKGLVWLAVFFGLFKFVGC